MLVTGKDAHTGSPRELTIHASDVLQEVESCVSGYQLLIEKMLSEVKPELTVDVIDKGLLLSGGLAQLDGLELFLTQKMGIPVVVVDEPDECVIKGIANVLEHLDLFRESLGYYVNAT
jgi:rod shape-determining protein MreB and related proteins